MKTIKEALVAIRAIATNWLSDHTTDGATAMREVTCVLLDTGFEEPYIMLQASDAKQNTAKILAEFERLTRPALSNEIAEAAMLQAGIDPELYTASDESRMDVIGQNGNDGEHYAESTGDGWIKWDADACACRPTNVAAVRFRNGTETTAVSGVNWAPQSDSFRHTEVIAYKLLSNAQPS